MIEVGRTTLGRVYRHRLPVRIAHGVFALAIPALLVTGAEIFAHHPEFYWGENGFFGDPALISLGKAETTLGLGFALGEARSVHFAAAWLLVAAWTLHLAASLLNGHLAGHLTPARSELRWRHLRACSADHLRLRIEDEETRPGYNTLQKLAYLVVLLVLVPAILLSGLAMSPAVTAAYPDLLTLFGGRQSARTVHGAVAAAFLAFLVIHLAMLALANPRVRLRAIWTGWYASPPEKLR